MKKVSKRRFTLRLLLNRHQISESVALSPQPGQRNSMLAGLQVAITALIALPLIQLSPYSHLIGFASLGTLIALFGRFAPREKRGWIVFLCLLCQSLTVFTMSTAVWAGMPVEGQLLLLALMCGILFYLVMAGDFGPPGALIFVFAASVSMAEVDSFTLVLYRTAATAVAAMLAWCVCMVTEILRERSFSAEIPVGAAQSARKQAVAITRIIIGSGVAGFIAYGYGGQYPGWAAMGAVAVLQGAHLHITMNRALQRSVGNIVGATLAGAILLMEPSIWTVIFLVSFLCFATEVIIGSNYGLGQILVTPMALFMSYLAMPEFAGVAMAQERVLDTVTGAAVGMIFAVAFSTMDDRRHLARHHVKRRR